MMKNKKFFMTALIGTAMMCVAVTGCNKEDNILDGEMNSDIENIQLRSDALGFTDVNDYQAFVDQQCAAGNHENCCLLNDGTHRICSYPNHLGINSNGTHHHGSNHKGHGNQSVNCANPNCTGFVDTNGDGVCDNHTQSGNCTNPNCTGFVDANGDGVCDNHTGTRPQDGTGGGHHGQHN